MRTEKIRVRVTNEPELRDRYLRDLSENGLFILSDPPVPVGHTVEVELLPPGWADPLLLKGQVVRVADDEIARSLRTVGFAVKLEPPNEWTRVRLSALLAQHGRHKQPPRPAGPPAPVESRPPRAPDLVAAQLEQLAHEREQLAAHNQALQAQVAELATQSQASVSQTQAKLDDALSAWSSLTEQLIEAERRITANAEKITELEREAHEAKQLAEQLAREKTARDEDHRRETSALAEELDSLRKLLARRKPLVPYLLLVLAAAVGYSVWADVPWLRPLRALLPKPAASVRAEPPLATTPEQKPTPEPDAGQALLPSNGPPRHPAGAIENSATAQEDPADAGSPAGDDEQDRAHRTPSLEVKSDAPARVWVDGKFVGRTPIDALELKPGVHKLRFRCLDDPTRVRETVKVNLVAGRSRVVRLRCENTKEP